MSGFPKPTGASTANDRRHAPIDLEQRRLRVGYISSDLRDHAIGYLMVEFFELHAKSDVEVFAYYCGPEFEQRAERAVQSRRQELDGYPQA